MPLADCTFGGKQGHQRSFANIGNVLWFVIVTMSTVGYGDLAPVTLVGRIVTTAIMILGMGILSLFTAAVVRSLVLGGANRARRMVDQIKERRRHELALLHEHLSQLGAAYNPLVALFDSSDAPATTSSNTKALAEGRQRLAEASDLHESVALNHATRVTEETSTEAELMFAQVRKDRVRVLVRLGGFGNDGFDTRRKVDGILEG